MATEMEARALEMVEMLSRRRAYDFIAIGQLQTELGWGATEVAMAVEYAAGRGWLRAFGPAAEPVGVSLHSEGMRMAGASGHLHPSVR